MLLLLLLGSSAFAQGSQEAIIITGGKVGGAEDQQDFRSSELLLSSCPVAALPRSSYGHATFTMADGAVLTCGGNLASSCIQLSPDLSNWSPHSTLTFSNQASNVVHAVLADGAYVMGRNSGAYLPTGSSQWQSFSIPQDHDARSSCAVAISATSFLLIGGFYEQGDFVDEYESLSGEWRRWPQRMPQRRENMACAKFGDNVLITGGYNRAVNEYDGATVILELDTRKWRVGGDLSWAREDHGISVLSSGRVVAYGGGQYGDDTVEEWDASTETWTPLQEKMELERSDFGFTVINVVC